jgi:hypothetical protein
MDGEDEITGHARAVVHRPVELRLIVAAPLAEADADEVALAEDGVRPASEILEALVRAGFGDLAGWGS